jgi:hypothetical protein
MTAAATVVETRKVVIHLAALTRVEYTEVLEVPADLDDDQLEALVDARSEEVDAGKSVKTLSIGRPRFAAGKKPMTIMAKSMQWYRWMPMAASR